MVNKSNSNRIESVGDINLNLDFWDCECKENYIKHISIKYCSKCNSFQSDQPNSRQNEVKLYISTLR